MVYGRLHTHAEATLLTRGNEEKPLAASQVGNTADKNEPIDLQTALDLNAITLSDPTGDEAVIKLFVQQPLARALVDQCQRE